MQSKGKVELINLAVQKLIDEKNSIKYAYAQDDDQLLLSKLLSQGDEVLKKPGVIPELKEATAAAGGEVETEDDNAGQVTEISREETVNELRRVKRQNFIIHCLLSVMIVHAAIWQLAEVTHFDT